MKTAEHSKDPRAPMSRLSPYMKHRKGILRQMQEAQRLGERFGVQACVRALRQLDALLADTHFCYESLQSGTPHYSRDRHRYTPGMEDAKV